MWNEEREKRVVGCFVNFRLLRRFLPRATSVNNSEILPLTTSGLQIIQCLDRVQGHQSQGPVIPGETTVIKILGGAMMNVTGNDEGRAPHHRGETIDHVRGEGVANESQEAMILLGGDGVTIHPEEGEAMIRHAVGEATGIDDPRYLETSK